MTRRRTWRGTRSCAAPGRAALLALVLLACVARRAEAQQDMTPVDDGGPIIVGERPDEFRTFAIERFRAALGFFARYRTEAQRRAGEPNVRDTETSFETALDLSMDAYIVHPNLIDLDLHGRLRVEHETLDARSLDVRERTLTFDNEYDFRALILGRSNTPLTLYSRRFETSVDRTFSRPFDFDESDGFRRLGGGLAFGPSLDAITTEHGVSLRLINERAPTLVQFFRREHEQHGIGGVVDFRTTQHSFNVQSDVRIDDRLNLRLDYTFDDIVQSGARRRAASFQRHDGSALHTWRFGDEGRHELRSRLRWLEQTGDFPFRRAGINEMLRLRHSDTLQTRYDLLYENTSFGEAEQHFLRGNANVRHQLFESLVTTANLGASRLDADAFTSDEIFGDVRFDYTKRIPYGRLSANTSFSVNHQENTPRGDPLRILDERHTFRDPTPIFLTRQNIVPASIVVTDLTGTIVYAEGPDYTVRAFPDRVEIRRVVGGNIADGQTVLIDYVIGPQPSSTFLTTGLGAGARYDIIEGPLAGLAFYLQYFQRDRSIDSPRPEFFIVDEVRDLLFGSEYGRGPLTVGVEHRRYDSTIAPFNSTRFEGRYLHRAGRYTTLSLDGSYTIIDFPRDDNRVNLALVSGRWSQQLNPDLRFNLWAIFRDERDELRGHSQGFEQQADLSWRIRQTHLYVAGRNSIFTTRNEDRTRQSVEVGIRRIF